MGHWPSLLIDIKEIELFVSVSKITINKSEYSKKNRINCRSGTCRGPNQLVHASEAWNLTKSESAA